MAVRKKPLVVITRGRLLDSTPQPLPPTMRAPVAHLWETMQNELAAVSSNRIHTIALRSGHFVQRSPDGQPDVVGRYPDDTHGISAVVRFR